MASPRAPGLPPVPLLFRPFRPRGPGALLAPLMAAALLLPSPSTSQQVEVPDSVGGRFLTLPAGVTLGVGVQLQLDLVVVERPREGESNGFRVDDARVRLYGTLPRGVSWRLTTDSGELLDVRLRTSLPRGFEVDLGLFKPPLTGEYIASSRNLDFVSRSRVVRTLVRGRDVGLVARWKGTPLSLEAALVNGDGAVGGEGEGGLMGVLRTDLGFTRAGGDSLRLGASLAANGDPERFTGEGLERRYQAVERLVSADVRVVRGPLLLSAEWVRGMPGTLEGEDPRGGHVTVGGRPAEGTELLLRLDALHPGGDAGRTSRQLVAGISHRPTDELRFLANLFVPLETGDGGEPDQGLRFFFRSQLYF